MENIKRILVVSRSTLHCPKALHFGITLARNYEAALYVLHVIHDPFNLDGWNLPGPSFNNELVKMKATAKKRLDQMIASEKAEGITVTEWIREGEPVKEILAVVKKENIDLLILLAHEEGRLEHFLFGRTNEEILRKMPCSILLVKQNYAC